MSKKVVRHPSSPPTPDLLLRDLLDKADHIKNITVCGVYDDNSFFFGWSEQSSQDVTFSLMQLQAIVLRSLADDD